MLEFFMSYFDVLYPINLGPLTYKCPEELEATAQPGMIVSAPLKNKLTKGVIINRNISPPDEKIKEFSKIHGDSPVLSKSLLKLLQWMSEYYIAPGGLVLKQTLPKEVFIKTKIGKAKKTLPHDKHIEFPDIPEKEFSSLTASISSGKYNAFLLHAPSSLYEYAVVLRLLDKTRNILVLLPEIFQANMLYNAFKESFGERLCILHSEISRGRRSEYIEGIISGRYDIVIGTRAALFAPLKNVSLIIVLNEHSSSYKLEEGIRYNIRDVAVMRGFIEKATVLLSSVTPTVDSYYNSFSDKYKLIKPSSSLTRPKIRIIDMRFEKTVKPNFSKTVYEDSKHHIKKGKKLMFVINRRGYSTLLLCRECGNAEKCPECGIPLVLHKNESTIRCHYCGKAYDIPDRCSRCKSYSLELLGSGTQKVQEDIEALFGVETLRFDSDHARKRTDIEKLLSNISCDSSKVIVGTKMMTKRIGLAERFSMAAVLNIDNSLNLPDFRASEKVYRELSSIIGLVDSDGKILIQTRMPQNSIFKYLKSDRYSSFVKEELSIRKELNYPPYSKLINIIFTGNHDLSDRIIKTVHKLDQDIEVLGPIVHRDKKGRDEFSILLKSADRRKLNTAARAVLDKFRDSKETDIRIDVDPV